MAKTVKERVRAWRARKMEEGGRSLSAWLEPDTAEKMRFLRDYFGETTSPLVARAIDALYQMTVNGREKEESTAVDFEPRARSSQRPAAASVVDQDSTRREAEIIDELVGGERPQQPLERHGSEAPPGQPCPPVEDPVLQEMAARLQQGVPFREMRSTLLVRWLQDQKAQGLTFEQMAQRLNEAEIPTLTGKGAWQPGMIPAFLLLSRSRRSS